ncbi:SOS response-associated peptidase family protein [Allosphingosinicella indica]|uniref:Putative SOS response-associated peptidase YedK n=1 Tax=Allosphingosinicella indica TaxID=941907 RepID=A0A1X7G8F1_9SPHN|nr:SOS response-associated peptidase family protein [Allosphingosinicella indica]SMF65810.1 Putative SOS response-associated peptidase YedK [Allosphingosinicella indica]
MCNEAYRRRELEKIVRDWSETGITLRFPEGRPNFAPLDGFRITDRVEIIRPAADAPGEAEMVTRRWSWPGPNKRPVYNFRSDGRIIAAPSRCLIPVEGFFEFTDPPPPPPGAPKPAQKPLKSKWAFTLAGHDWFCIAGIWRNDPEAGEAWAMLTCPPGPDIAPYHDRQVVVLGLADCVRWLDPAVPAVDLCRPLPAGSLAAEQVR